MTDASQPSRPLRVIQWATGAVGAEALAAMIDRPDLELVGVRVHTDAKHGVDAGDLCGRPPTGVTATTSTEDILALDADAVVYAPRHADLDEVCALASSGKNVVCTPFLFHGGTLSDTDRERVQAACATGGVSVHGTGLHPGFVGMVLPLVVSGMARTIDHVHIVERADWTYYGSPRITFDNMRFGHPPEEATLEANPFARFNADLFAQQIHMLADAFGTAVDRVDITQELTVAPESRDVLAGHLEAGTVSGQRYRWRGVRADRALIEIEALWTLGGFYPDTWPRPRDGWTVSIEGDPSFQTHFLMMATLGARQATIEDHVHAADIATAMQAVNSIPAVCAAAPGLRASHELALVRSGLGFGA